MDKAVRSTVETLGACNAEDWTLFTTEKPADQAKAKLICRACPVQEMCLNEFFHEDGVVVGGTTPKERRRMVQQMDLPLTPAGRLAESFEKGGIRALMIDACLTEEEAIKVSRHFRVQERVA